MRRTILSLAAVLALAPVSTALGKVTVARDAKGRAITIDVRASEASAASYARILRRAVHGREIAEVTVVVVPVGRITVLCGDRTAVSCYETGRTRARIVVPAGAGPQVTRLLLHEYGHHIDASRENGDRPEPNGTPRWWAARRMGSRLRAGQVAFDYSRGWARSVGEVFAEDYVQLAMAGEYGIPWLPPPSATILAALRKDLQAPAAAPVGEPTPAPDPAPTPEPPAAPVVVQRTGQLEAGEGGSLPFSLLGPGRRVRVDLVVSGLDAPASVEAVVACDGIEVLRATGTDGSPVAFEQADLGPGECELTLVSTAGAASYDLQLTLSRPA
jgi:hypothetical protein